MSGNAKFRWFLLAPILVALFVVTSSIPWAEHYALRKENKNAKFVLADKAMRLALVDTLFYRYDKWFSTFGVEIERLKHSPKNLVNKSELMKFHFAFAGLTGELTHTLAFTSKFSIPEIKEDFIFHSKRVKELAYEILDQEGANLIGTSWHLVTQHVTSVTVNIIKTMVNKWIR